MNDDQDYTKENLTEAFWKLYVKKDLSQITVKDITKIAGYNRSTFYYHFEDTQDLFQHFKLNILKKIEQDIYFSIKRNKYSYVPKIYQNIEPYLKVLLNEDKHSGFLDDYKTYFKSYYTISWNLDLSDPSVNLILEFALSGIMGSLKAWYKNSNDVSYDQLILLLRMNLITGPFTCLGVITDTMVETVKANYSSLNDKRNR